MVLLPEPAGPSMAITNLRAVVILCRCPWRAGLGLMAMAMPIFWADVAPAAYRTEVAAVQSAAGVWACAQHARAAIPPMRPAAGRGRQRGRNSIPAQLAAR